MKMPFLKGEGPYGLIVCPSRELAKQTHEVFEFYANHLKRAGYPHLRCARVIGGEPVNPTKDLIR
jgi:ATP-dependent RNA helicase DDX41